MKTFLNFYSILFLFNVTFSQKNKKENIDNVALNNFPKFEIPLSQSSDINSIYFYKTIEDKLTKLDTTVTSEQIISLTKYKISEKIIKPKYLDSLYQIAYKLNEEKKHSEAVAISKIILEQSPNNIAGIKEISLAYRKLGNEDLADSYFSILVKVVNSVFKYGDGSFEFPYILNNFSEGISIYEVAFRCKPTKTVLMLDKHKRLLGAYNGYSSALDNIIIRYSELSHWRNELNEDDYIIQNE